MVNFSFVIDGKVDMFSLNPLEMTNFEMAGAVFGILGVILHIILSRRASHRQLPHHFTATQTEEGAID